MLSDALIHVGVFELDTSGQLIDVAGLTTLYANLSLDGNTYSWSWSPNYVNSTGTTSKYWAYVNPQWDIHSGTPLCEWVGSTTVNFQYIFKSSFLDSVVTYPSYMASSSTYQMENIIIYNPTTLYYNLPVSYNDGYHFQSTTATVTGDLTAFDIATFDAAYPTSTVYDGITESIPYTYTGVVSASTIKFNPSDPAVSDVTYITAFYKLTNQIQLQKSTTTQSYNSSQNPLQDINYWNSTSSFSISPPSYAANNPSVATTSGNVNASTIMTWNINHIAVAGYNQKPITDILYYSGYQKGNKSLIPNPPQYTVISESANQIVNAAMYVNMTFSEYVAYLISATANPPNLAVISQSPVTFSLSYSSPIALSKVSLYISGTLEDVFSGQGLLSVLSYSYSDPSFSPETVQWVMTTGEYTQYLNLTYGGSTTPTENSSSLIVMQSATVTQSYPITITGSPSGTGTYQQLFSIVNYTKYGINSKGSNFIMSYSDGTNLYSWVQAINTTTLTFWSNIANGTTSVLLNVYPIFDELMGKSSYLGEAPELSATYGQYDNGKLVFPIYFNFAGSVLSSQFAVSGANGTVAVNNGITISTNANYPAFEYVKYDNPINNNSMMHVIFHSTTTTNAGFGLTPTLGGYSFMVTSGGLYYNSFGATGGDGQTFTSSSAWTALKEANQTYGLQRNNASSFYTYNDTLSYLATVFSTSYNNDGNNLPWLGIPFNMTSQSISFYAVFITSSMPHADIPTYTISATGTAFMANASTTGSFQGIPGRLYNTTYQNMIYDIPLAPTTNYLTVIINDTWQFSDLYPSSYVIQENGKQVLFTGINDFGSIQVTTIQPSLQLGQSEPIALTYLQKGSNIAIGYQYYQDFSVSISYVPFGSSTPIDYVSGASNFNLPYGASASISILDYWQQAVGSATFTVPDHSLQIDVLLNISSVTFLENQTLALMSSGSVSIQSGSYNLSGANPEYIANGSSYVWYASAIDPQTFQMVLYSGIVKGNATSQTVIVPIGSPISSLTINAVAFNGSGIGKLGNGGPSTGNPTVILRIDGAITLLDTTFVGIMGQTYNITIYDVLGHLLLQKNITLVSPQMPVTLNIIKPSYVIGFVNNEIVNSTSPLATQDSTISEINTTRSYSFTTHVSQESEIYLTPGYYHLYTHDNLTNSMNINLVNTSLYYAFNSQNISKTTQKLFNYSSMQLFISLYAPYQQVNVSGNATISLYLIIAGKQSLLNQSQTESVIHNMTIEILLNGVFYTALGKTYSSPGVVTVFMNISKLSTAYTLNVTITPTIIDNKALSWQGSQGFSVVSYNPANPPNTANGLASFLTSLPMELLYAILAIGEVLWLIYKRSRKGRDERDQSIDNAGTTIEAIIALKVMNKEPLTPAENAAWDVIDKRTRDELITRLTSGKRRVFVFRVRRVGFK
jgi:hypothetical protein